MENDLKAVVDALWDDEPFFENEDGSCRWTARPLMAVTAVQMLLWLIK